MAKIELRDLAFTAADFKFVDMCDSETSVSRYGPSQGQAERIADEANRILAEKIGRAERVYGHKGGNEFYWGLLDGDVPDTHTARLVCIEVLEGKDE